MDLIEKAARRLRRADPESVVERAAKKIDSAAVRTTDANVVKAAEPVGRDAAEAATGRPLPRVPLGRRTQAPREVTIDFDRLTDLGFIAPGQEPTQIAEEFRVIKRSLIANAFKGGAQARSHGNLVLVTSAQPGEGKTFCTVNLAMSIASERDLTVLLIDADFAKPSVPEILGFENSVGLVDVIDDENLDLSDCMLRTNLPNLRLLPAGRPHNLTTELLASDRMKDIVEELAKRYPDRVIIFDSPPVLASSAPGTLASYMGQVLFVVEADRTNTTQIKTALSQLASCETVSLILNKNRVTSGSELFGSYYGYGNRYGYGYGQKEV